MVRRWVSIVAALVVTFVLLIALVFYLSVRFMPFNAGVLEKVHQPSIVYANDGSQIMTLGSQNTDLQYKQIPKDLQNAVVATEDHTFWTNSGVDIKSILRSMVVDTLSRSYAQGGSTIPEQLAKMVYLTDKKTLLRKYKEIVLGVQIERNFTKKEILKMYLNRVPMGESSTGIEQGAMRYFGIDLRKDPSKLTLADAALLAGLPNAPSAYDPLQHPKAATARRNLVLENMAKWGYISEAKAKQAEKAPLGVKFHSMPGDSWSQHPLLTNFLLDYLDKKGFSPSEVEQGGLKIYTTISSAVQNAVNQVFYSGNYNADFPGPTSGTVVQGSGIFVDPKTGAILGAAGSRQQNFAELGLDRVYAGASPGSSIKPVMEYAPAIESGKWSYTSVLDNQFQDFGGYTPHNWNEGSAPSKVTLQYGLEWSQNIASVWLLQQIGMDNGVAFAKKDGIPVPSNPHLGIAIGGGLSTSPMDMVSAYTPFDNQGVRSQPYLINKMVNAQGQTIYHESTKQTQVMSASTASAMTRLMQDVVDFGTGQSAKLPNWGVAGKTGTVQYDSGISGSHPNWVRDGWFDGYTPTIVGSIHIAYDHADAQHHMTMSPVDPSGNAAKIFHDVIALALQNQQPQQFAEGPYPYETGTQNGVDYVNQQNSSQSQPSAKGLTGVQAAYDAGSNSVKLTWNGSFPSQVIYTVTRQTLGPNSNGQEMPIGETSSTTLTDPNVQVGNTYQYTVQATDANSGQVLGSPVTTTVQVGTPAGQGQGQGQPPGSTTDNGTGQPGGPGGQPPGGQAPPNGGTSQGGSGTDNSTGSPTTTTTPPTTTQGNGPGHGRGHHKH